MAVCMATEATVADLSKDRANADRATPANTGVMQNATDRPDRRDPKESISFLGRESYALSLTLTPKES